MASSLLVVGGGATVVVVDGMLDGERLGRKKKSVGREERRNR